MVNADPDTQGYLRQMGTYEWFEGVEPGEENNFMDINGNGRHDRQSNSSRVQKPVRGWTVLDPKGFWLPNKIYFDLSRVDRLNMNQEKGATEPLNLQTRKESTFILQWHIKTLPIRQMILMMLSIVEDFRSFLIAHLPQIQLVVITKFSIALIIRLAKM